MARGGCQGHLAEQNEDQTTAQDDQNKERVTDDIADVVRTESHVELGGNRIA